MCPRWFRPRRKRAGGFRGLRFCEARGLLHADHRLLPGGVDECRCEIISGYRDACDPDEFLLFWVHGVALSRHYVQERQPSER